MGDFDKFLDYLKKGDMNGVKETFHGDFLNKLDDYKSRPIHHACFGQHLEIAKFLIEKNCEVDGNDNEGRSPIHRACYFRTDEMAKILIEHGCDRECEDNAKWRPIHHASYLGRIGIVKMLVGKGCELQCQNINGETPLGMAKQYKRKDCEDFLTEALKLPKGLQQPNLTEPENTDSFKAALNRIFSEPSQFSRLKTWFQQRKEIPRGTLSRCHIFDDIFYEISKPGQYDLLIEYCESELDHGDVGDIMKCFKDYQRSGTKGPNS